MRDERVLIINNVWKNVHIKWKKYNAILHFITVKSSKMCKLCYQSQLCYYYLNFDIFGSPQNKL